MKKPSATRSSPAWFISPYRDPPENLALEEYLLRETKGAFLFFWFSPPSVVIGKNQVVWREVDAYEAWSRKIPVYRRISGGGTVYHDPGNLNFSFIDHGPGQVDFQRFLQPMANALNAMGIPSVRKGKSDLYLGGKKISGNAQYCPKGRVLHHGTLLVNSDLEVLNRLLSPSTEFVQSRGISSNRAKVTNLTPYLRETLSPEAFAERLGQVLTQQEPGMERMKIPADWHPVIAHRARIKFSEKEWILGSGPDYLWERIWKVRESNCSVKMRVERGRIAGFASTPSTPPRWANQWYQCLKGLWHEPESIMSQLSSLDMEMKISHLFDWFFSG